MNAFLLCAGFGTRMQPLTQDTPKSLARVAGRPIIDYLTDELATWKALDTVHVAVNNRDAPAFLEWAFERRPELAEAGIDLRVHDDGVETPEDSLGLIGDLAFLLGRAGLPEEGALVSGGDSLYRFPLAPLLNAYDGRSNQVLALYEPDPERRAHSSLLQLDGRTVTEVVEDPAGAGSERICPSWALLRPEALQLVEPYLEEGGAPDKLGPFLNRVARQQGLRAVPLPKQRHLRLHCNTVDDLERARRLLHDEPRHLLDPGTTESLAP